MTLCKEGLPDRTVWLVIKRTLGAAPSYAYAISNAPASTPLSTFVWLRRFLKKNILIQEVGAGLIKMSYLGKAGWRSNRFSTPCIAAFPSAMPFW